MPSTRRSLLLASAGALVGIASDRAAAQANTQTTRIFVPFSAGALTDIIARIYADKCRVLSK